MLPKQKLQLTKSENTRGGVAILHNTSFNFRSKYRVCLLFDL